jgi:hypothetical protein
MGFSRDTFRRVVTAIQTAFFDFLGRWEGHSAEKSRIFFLSAPFLALPDLKSPP